MVSAARRAIERLYKGKCTIIECRDVKDPVSKITSQQEVAVLEDQPCRLSHKQIPSAGDASPAAPVTQSVKVFMAPEIEVKPGSKLIITQNGVTGEYKKSGEPAVKSSHQEISLELFKGWT